MAMSDPADRQIEPTGQLPDQVRTALVAELERHRPAVRPPVALLLARRRRRRRRRAAGTLALSVAVVATAVTVGTLATRNPDGVSLLTEQSPTPAVQPTRTPGHEQPSAFDEPGEPVDGLRTDPGGRGLVVNYTGGACDGPARLDVQEAPDRVDLRVVVDRAADTCIAIGISRTLSARLKAPLGERVVWAGPQRLVPFDGARLLEPGYLPPGSSLRQEDGRGTGDRESPVRATWWWTRTYGAPRTVPDCSLDVGGIPWFLHQGPADEQGFTGQEWQDRGLHRVGAATARLRESRYEGERNGWALTWEGAGGTVTLSSRPACDEDAIPSEAEFLRVARSLRPAS